MDRYSFPDNFTPDIHARGYINDASQPLLGFVMTYELATQNDALALHDAAAVRTKKKDVREVSGISYIDVTYPLIWQVPFVKHRYLRDCTVTFVLHDLLDQHHDLSKVRDIIHEWVKATLLNLHKNRAAYKAKMSEWQRPSNERRDWIAPKTIAPIPPVLLELWSRHKQRREA